MVVSVDQAGGHHLAAHIQHARLALVGHAAVLCRQIGRGAHPQHGRAVGHQCTVLDFAALRIHGDQYVGIQGNQGHEAIPL